jgi:hypothetical protein
MNYFPDNTMSNFKTRLAKPISLNGAWEVGLYEIQYQRSWYTLGPSEGFCRFNHFDNKIPGVDSTLRIPAGYYESIHELLNVLNSEIATLGVQYRTQQFPQFDYNELTRKVTANIYSGNVVEFSKPLAHILGVDQKQNPIKYDDNKADHNCVKWEATNSIDLNKGIQALYVYCDILEHVPIGDVIAPLLRVVAVSGKHGDIIHKIYDKPLYVPLQKKHFDNLEINIMSSAGELIPFECGQLMVSLHFRLSSSPYFLQ